MKSFDLNAEKAILGCCLLDPALLEQLGSLDPARMSGGNAEILQAMRKIWNEGVPLTLPVLCSRLSSAGRLEHCGGAGYIASATDGVAGTLAEVEECAAAINLAAERRDIAAAASRILAECRSGRDPALVRSAASEFFERRNGCAPEPPDWFVAAAEFITVRPPSIVWDVDGVIQSGANGFIAGAPKAGKSWIGADLAISLAGGSPWMGFETRKRRVALISREDAPALTSWRLKALCHGRGLTVGSLENLWVNSKAQSSSFRLDDRATLGSMIGAIKAHRAEFVVLDVMNVLHGADENDATQMRRVMDSLTLMGVETGAGICVLHHFNKAGEGNLTQRLRGSSAISGWAEYVIAVEHKGEGPRRVNFELKAASSPPPLDVTVESEGSIVFLRHGPAVYPEPSRQHRRVM